MFSQKYLLSLLFATITTFPSLGAQQDIKNTEINNWHLSTPNDSIQGIDAVGAHKLIESLSLKPRPLIVAVLDGGMDIDNEDLKPQIFRNKKEKLDGKDNDKNGYIDDIHGWNFLGGAQDSINLESVGTIFFREYKRLSPEYENISEDAKASLSDNEKNEYQYFLSMRKKAGIGSYLQFFEYLKLQTFAYLEVDSLLKHQYPGKATTLNDLRGLAVDSISQISLEIVNSRTFMADSTDLWKPFLDEKISEYKVAEKRVNSLGDRTSVRDIIGDNENDITDIYYGNKNVKVDVDHGTFVAGIIGATRNNGIGIDGITNNVQIMPVRIVPNGDEYDKDVAVGIKYAVDNGAKIINMSFAKYLSPNNKWLEDAVEYATSKNVLLVQAAGNDGYNLDSIPAYPTRYFSSKKASDTFIRVGATNERGEPISISNYGKKEVELFAPGYNVYSSVGNNEYMKSQGTSIAAPMVTGVAALIWAYYPKLTAAQIKSIIVGSVTRKEAEVNLPGKSSNKKVVFSELSQSGGILNALSAFKEARKVNSKRK